MTAQRSKTVRHQNLRTAHFSSRSSIRFAFFKPWKPPHPLINPDTSNNMFRPSSSNVSLPRAADLEKASVCASANLMVDDCDDIDSSSSNAVDAMAFLQQANFQIEDHGGEMVDDDLFFDLFDEDMNDDDGEEPPATSAARNYDHIPPPPGTPAKTSKDNRRSSMPSRLPSHQTVAQIRSLEAQLAETMRRTNMSRAVVLGSRRQSSCSVSNVSSTASTTSTFSSSASSTASAVGVTPKKIASTEAFLAGKRSTLTPALEQSRRQLQRYMEQLDMSM